MATLVIEQEETIAAVDNQAIQVEKDTSEGYVSEDLIFPSMSSLIFLLQT
jgi:t-SNARE complex subunit (syntaxin)